MAVTPPANWYPDPNSELQQRWWDGNGWTTSTRPLPPPAQPLPPSSGPVNAQGIPQPLSPRPPVNNAAAMVREAIPGPGFKPGARFGYALGLSLKKRKYWKEIQTLAPFESIDSSTGRTEADIYVAAYIGATLLWVSVQSTLEESPPSDRPEFLELLPALLKRGLCEVYGFAESDMAQHVGLAIMCLSGLAPTTRYAHLCVKGFTGDIPSQDAKDFEHGCAVALATVRELFVKDAF